MLHNPSDGIVTVQGNQHQQGIADGIGQGIGDEPPDLPLQDQIGVKVEPVEQRIAGIHHPHKVDDGGADGDIEHQIGDALVPVSVAEPVKIPAQIFHGDHLVKSIGTILPVAPGKVQSQL